MALFIAEFNKLRCMEMILTENNVKKFDEECSHYHHKGTFDNEHMYDELKNILKTLENYGEFIKSSQNIQTLNLKQFKKDMIELQDRIQNVKRQLQFKLTALQQEETEEFNNVNKISNQNIIDWETRPVSRINIRIPTQIVTNIENENIKEFIEFVDKTGGHQNGWSTSDHSLFCKLRAKYRNSDHLAINLHKLLPDISKDAINEHNAWYSKYLVLKNKKREAVNKWRETKNNAMKSTGNMNIKNEDQVKILQPPANRNNKDLIEKLTKWREEKEAKLKAQLETETLEKEKIKNRELMKLKTQQEAKKSVELWKKTKNIMLENKKLKEEQEKKNGMHLRRNEATEMMKQFRSQDVFYVMRMRRVRDKLKVKHTIQKRVPKHIMAKDPSRLFKPTKQWLMRTEKVETAEKRFPQAVPNISLVQKLHIPDWRKSTPDL